MLSNKGEKVMFRSIKIMVLLMAVIAATGAYSASAAQCNKLLTARNKKTLTELYGVYKTTYCQFTGTNIITVNEAGIYLANLENPKLNKLYKWRSLTLNKKESKKGKIVFNVSVFGTVTDRTGFILEKGKVSHFYPLDWARAGFEADLMQP